LLADDAELDMGNEVQSPPALTSGLNAELADESGRESLDDEGTVLGIDKATDSDPDSDSDSDNKATTDEATEAKSQL
jgi:hypothetical protein